jgi:hypothetical protein
MSEAKPKVLYVIGTGRSGSTILGLALGNCAGVICAGELHLWLGKDGRSPLKGEERQRFWGKVRAAVELPEGFPAREAGELEKSASLLRAGSRRRRRRLRAAYLRVTEQLYRAIARTGGAELIVDTSHFPLRARNLQALDGIELYLLYVVRDPANVVGSYARDKVDFPRFNLLTTNAYLWLTHLLSLPVFLRHPREQRLLVHYEQFVAEPEAVLREILDALGSDAALPNLDELRTGVAFQGNALLRRDVVALRPQPERPAPGARVTRLLNLPLSLLLARIGPAVSAGRRGRPG